MTRNETEYKEEKRKGTHKMIKKHYKKINNRENTKHQQTDTMQ